jgi:hypothetical protein
MKLLAIARRGFALLQTVITHHAGNAQSIVVKQVIAASLLCTTVLFEIAPGADSGLVTPEGQRQQFAGLTQTFKSFDRYESIDFAQLGRERSGDFQVLLFAFGNGLEFKNYG